MDILSQPEALPTSVKWIEADLNNPTVAADSSYDVIISTEVIEHLENPRGVFRELHRLLRPGGTLIVTTPNQESIRSYLCLLLDGHYAGFRDASYPAHITALLRKDFERVCGETGFAPPRFFYTECGGIPKFPRFHWQEVLFGLARGRLFSDNVAIKTEKC
jgi:2-polyprenyl-3-methyl-5-hydroxy-6-metoxy-1,4-benzoquinol methylase